MRWRPQDEKKLLTYVRKFNAAITRLEKLNPDAAGILPERMNAKELRNTIGDRTSFNRKLKSIDRFFKPGARKVVQTPDGALALKWEVQEARYNEQSAAARRFYKEKKLRALIKDESVADQAVRYLGKDYYKNRLKKQQTKFRELTQKALEPKGKDKATTLFKERYKTDIGDYANVFLPPGSINESLQQSWRNFVYSVDYEANDKRFREKDQTYYNNYLQSVETEFGSDYAQAVKVLMEEYNITPKELYLATLIDDNLSINYIYGPEQAAKRIEYVLDYLIPTIDTIRSVTGT